MRCGAGPCPWQVDPFLGEPRYVRFLTGGFASMTAEFFTLPIDGSKVRMQLQGSQVRTGGAHVPAHACAHA